MSEKETYTLPLFEELDDGSDGIEQVTVKKSDRGYRSSLTVTHERKDSKTTDRYTFQVADEEKQICAYDRSYGESPEYPPNRVMQAVAAFGYEVKNQQQDTQIATDLQTINAMADDVGEIVSQLRSSDAIDHQLSAKYVEYTYYALENLYSALYLYYYLDEMHKEDEFISLQEQVIEADTIGQNSAEELHMLLDEVIGQMYERGIDEGHISKSQLADTHDRGDFV